MSREILFRGKSLITNEWVYGYYGVTIMGNHYINNGRNNINTHTSIDFKTLGQYTGLNDKNGVKIFEGDLIQLCDNKKGLLVVEFKNTYVGGWVLTLDSTNVHISLGARNIGDLEVIGNIHDNE